MLPAQDSTPTATAEPRAVAILTGLLRCESCEMTDTGCVWRMSHGITLTLTLDPLSWHLGVAPPQEPADAS